MDLNGVIFPAPPPSYSYETMQGSLFFVPRAVITKDGSDFTLPDKDLTGISHIPCLYLINAEGSSKLLIYFHGNAEDIGRTKEFMEILCIELRVHVVAIEYPGYGIYPGSPSTERIAQDSLNVFDFIVQYMKCPAKNIILFGRSIGTGFATHIASHRSPGLLILMSAFTSIKDVVKNLACLFSFLVADRLKNIELIPLVKCPKIFVHGKKDKLVPCEYSEKLFFASVGTKKLILNTNMDHNVFEVYSDFLIPIFQFWKKIGFSVEPDVFDFPLILNTSLPPEYQSADHDRFSCNL